MEVVVGEEEEVERASEAGGGEADNSEIREEGREEVAGVC